MTREDERMTFGRSMSSGLMLTLACAEGDRREEEGDRPRIRQRERNNK